MKKPKISLDKDKLQQFFLQHIEKILLVIVVGLMFLLIYRGVSLPHIDNSLSPQGLISQTSSAKQYIDAPDRWQEVAKTRPVDFDVVQRVGLVQKKSDPLAYMLVSPWSRPDFPKLSPRQDPELFPPQHLIVRPVMGVLASYPKTEEEMNDPLFPQMSDEDLKKLRDKMKRDEAKKKKLAASELGGEMPGGGGGAPARPARKKGKAAVGGEGGEMAGPGGGMPGGMGGAYGGGMMAGDRYPESLTYGFMPQSPEQTIRRIFPSVTIMAVVPVQKQTEEYEKKLANSLDYSPQRDTPYYMEFRVQRADVTEIDPATEADKLPWQTLPNPARSLSELYGDPTTGAVGLYAGIPMEVSDPSYLSEALTHPAPPYLQRDLWDLLTHPDVPLASFNSGYGEGMPGAAGPAAGGGDPGDDAPSGPAMGPAGMRGMGGMPGGGEGGMPGGGMMRPGFGRAGGGEGGMMPGGGMPGGGMMGGMRAGGGMPGGGMPGGGMMGGMRPGGMGMPGGGEGGMGYGGGMQTYTPPKHQLVRFTDKDVVPGHKYRYRFRVMVYDPNHPDLSMPPPSAASLHEDVRKRLKEQDNEDAAKPKSQQTGLAFRTYWRWTSWSDASPIAVVPRGERVFAGKVTPRAPMKVKNIDVPSEPSVTALTVVFDHAKKADVPAEISGAGRGYVLNFSLEGKDKAPKVIHPVDKQVVDLDKYNVTTNALVADLMGGDLIKAIVTGSAAQTLTGLGEMLIVDSDGRIHVQNEGDDILQFRRFTVPKPDPKAAKAPTDTASGLEGGPVGRRPTN